MSSEKFENLEDDFLSLKESLNAKLEDLLHRSSGEARKNLTRDIQRELDDAQHVLEELEGEARIAPYPFKRQMNIKLKQYRLDIVSLKKRLMQSESSLASSQRNQLLSYSDQPSSSSYDNVVLSNRSRLLQLNETIERTSESVYRSQQIAAETDQVGVGIVDELGTQRESLIRTKERLVDTDENLTKSRRILRAMYRRVITNKIILIVIILLELAILAGIVYYKFFKK